MKKVLLFLAFLFADISFFASNSFAERTYPDTVSVGIYVTSVHDVDFRQKEYSINLWLWLKYKRREFDFMKNLEVPMAKTFEKSYATLDTLEDGRIYILMKLQCVMKGTWKINDFPFDRQRLRFAIENSMYDANELVFSIDTMGKHYGKYFLMAWEKDSFNIRTEIKEYETSFGDPALDKPHSEYSSYKVTIVVHRESWELFFKLFLGMYISFLISFVCFYIHPDNMDSRLALSVGSLFAVIGNKYIIDSTLPESNTFTLVDTLHGITLFYIFLVIASSVYTLKLIKGGKPDKAKKYNRITGRILLLVYILLNVWFIYNAYNSEAFG
ncbi:MAG TPA: hypothetical protein VJY62_14420 [Bacteroidia bacterium]|nr:hypothetical protein [Bacteroidia bacterium]